MKFDENEKLMLLNRCEDSSFTYNDLLVYLLTLTPDQLKQNVQILGPLIDFDDHSIRLEPVYGIGTVEKMCHVDGEISTLTKSSDDFQHHPEQVVLLRDYSPFGKKGDTFYTMQDDHTFIGNKSGEVLDFLKNIKEDELENL